MMNRMLLGAVFGASILAGGALVTAPASAADVAAAVKTFEDVAASPEKMQTYCAMTKLIDDVGDDDKKAEASQNEIDGYFKALGPEFEEAWTAGDELGEDAPELKTLEDALSKLDAACGGGHASDDAASDAPAEAAPAEAAPAEAPAEAPAP